MKLPIFPGKHHQNGANFPWLCQFPGVYPKEATFFRGWVHGKKTHVKTCDLGVIYVTETDEKVDGSGAVSIVHVWNSNIYPPGN